MQLLNSADTTSAKNKLPPLPETDVFIRNSVLLIVKELSDVIEKTAPLWIAVLEVNMEFMIVSVWAMFSTI